LKDKIQENYVSIEKKQSQFTWEYDSPFALDSEIEVSFLRKLTDSRRKDLYTGSTSVGPHRDDLEILLNGSLMNEYASQGEAKSAALAIKLSIFDYLSIKLQETPILLLDEFSSDLDSHRVEALMAILPQLGQVFMTTAKASEFKRFVPINTEIRLDQGRLCGNAAV
jgi:DNA replication and repair protein RecF